MNAGVREYWIFDPDKKSLLLQRPQIPAGGFI